MPAGEMEMETGLLIVTGADADFVGSATEVAFTVSTAPGVVIGALGGVYKPVALNVPHGAPLQPVPESAHVTAVLDGPVTGAEN
jgi:hypothetical protein